MELAKIDRDWSRRLGIGPAPEASLPGAGVGTFALPEGIDHFLWRLILSDKLKVGAPADLDRWSYLEMLDAHAMLDAIEDALAKERADQERAARAQRAVR
jgi:hypothetical protein